jgi:hypothetical protein
LPPLPFPLPRFLQEFLDQLTCLHLVEGFDTATEQVLSHPFHIVFVELALTDDAEDESLLSFTATPGITIL